MMQQASYRIHPDAPADALAAHTALVGLIGRLAAELVALASMALGLSGGLLIAASYLI